jgi:hypothetical protein
VAAKDSRQLITEYLTELVGFGLIKDRNDIITALAEAGLEINRKSRDYISIRTEPGRARSPSDLKENYMTKISTATILAQHLQAQTESNRQEIEHLIMAEFQHLSKTLQRQPSDVLHSTEYAINQKAQDLNHSIIEILSYH